MKTRNCISIVALVALVATASASGLHKTILSVDKKVTSALMKLDFKAFESATRPNVTADFKHTENGASMNYDQMLAQMKASFGMFKKINSCSATLGKFTEKGSVGTANTRHRISAIAMGPDKKLHKFGMNGNTVDTWRKIGKDWKLAEMNWVNTKMTMDGKPFNPSNTGGN